MYWDNIDYTDYSKYEDPYETGTGHEDQSQEAQRNEMFLWVYLYLQKKEMKVYFRGKETIVKDLDYIGPDEEKDSKVYEKCLNAYLYMYIEGVTQCKDSDDNEYFIEED